MKTIKTALVGALAGVTAGALLGVLLAPGKGSGSNKTNMDTSGEFAEGLKDKFSKSKQGVKQKGNNLSKEADYHFANGKKKVEQVKGNFSHQSGNT